MTPLELVLFERLTEAVEEAARALQRIAANMEPLIVDTAADGMVQTIMDLALRKREPGRARPTP